MLRNIIYQRQGQMAATARDAQSGTYGVRVAATAIGGQDTFTTWQLSMLTYRPATVDELTFASAALSDEWRVWQIHQIDLDNALPLGTNLSDGPAPAPLPTYELTINGQLWIIEQILPTAFDQVFPCLSRLGR